MTRSTRHFLAFLVLATLAVVVACDSGDATLATYAFVDADGDLVCDFPVDEQCVDPDVLIFAYTPLEDPDTYAETWAEFMAHLAQATGKEVQFFGVHSNAAQLEAMRAGRLHITGFNTGSVPRAVNECGFVPMCIMAADDGTYGYEMEIIVPADSGIQTPGDLRGRQLAFTSPTSNSGFKSPSVLLQDEFGIDVETDIETVFSGRHENSILGVKNGDYEAAAVANSVLKRELAAGNISADDYRTIYKSATFPTTAYGYAYNLTPALREAIHDAFFSFDWTGTGLEEEFAPNGMTTFIPISYQDNWAIIRQIDAALGSE